MKLSNNKIRAIRKKILNHYKKHKRKLPWRNTTNPYKILVSEIMLQQTQVKRVIPKYKAFIKKYPTLNKLAHANKTELLQLWQGLGYNNRALRLLKLAQQAKKLPTTYKELLQLPSIGPYTANAILIFAHNKNVVTIDVNIKRTLLHELKLPQNTKLEPLAQQILPKGKSRDWHNALMDYGATKLTAKKTGITSPKQRPFKNSTRYYRGKILKLILEKKKINITTLTKHCKKPKKFLQPIMRTMEKEGIITINENWLSLQN